MTDEIIKKYRVRLTPVSPIHIGSGERDLNQSTDYIELRRKCFVLNDLKLARLLVEKGLQEKLSGEIETKKENFRLRDFLTRNLKLEEKTLEDISLYKIRTDRVSRLYSPRPFVRDGRHLPFIPGSSLKGTLRTAILFSMAMNLRDSEPSAFKKRVVELVDDKIGKFEDGLKKASNKRWYRDRAKKTFAEELVADLLQGFTVKREYTRRDPRTDILRVLHVSDSLKVEGDFTLNDASVLSLYRNSKLRSKIEPAGNRNPGIQVECFQKGYAEFEIAIDYALMAEFKKYGALPFDDLEDILKCCEQFSAELWKEDKDFFVRHNAETKFFQTGKLLSFYGKDVAANVRLGWGSGLLGTTIDMLLTEEKRKKIRNIFFEDRGDAPAPKSRKCSSSNWNNILQCDAPFGWAKLEVV